MKKQLIILWIGIGLVVLAILFPPWKMVHGGIFGGYGFLFSLSRYGAIESSRLTAEILIIALLTASAFYTAKIFPSSIKFLAWGVAVVIAVGVVTFVGVLLVRHWQAQKVHPWDSLPDAPAQVSDPEGQKAINALAALAPQPQQPRVYKTIHEAAEQGDLAAVKICLQKGIEVDARKKRGGVDELVRSEMNKDANVDGCYSYWTPLMLAAECGHYDVVQYLVEKGADVNDKDGMSMWKPLMRAVWNGHLDIVKYLVEKGADVNAKYGRWTPMKLAADKGYLDVVEFLKQHGAKE